MRHFKDGQVLVLELGALPPFHHKDLVVDRALSIASSLRGTSPYPPGTPWTATHLIGKERLTGRWMLLPASAAELVSRLPNASSALFTGAKIAHLSICPRAT